MTDTAELREAETPDAREVPVSALRPIDYAAAHAVRFYHQDESIGSLLPVPNRA